MKKLLLIVFFALISWKSTGQETKSNRIDLGLSYGYFGWINFAMRSNESTSTGTYLKSMSDLGSIGCNGAYQLTPRFTVELNVGYTSNKSDWQEVYSNNFFFEETDLTVTNYSIQITRIYTLASLYYHFLNREKFTFYGGLGLGYGFNDAVIRYYGFPAYLGVPANNTIAGQLTIGGRFDVSSKISLKTALGFGDMGILNVGVQYRLK